MVSSSLQPVLTVGREGDLWKWKEAKETDTLWNTNSMALSSKESDYCVDPGINFTILHLLQI